MNYYSPRRRRELEAPEKTAAEPLGPHDPQPRRASEGLDVLVVAAALASIFSDEAGRRVDVRACLEIKFLAPHAIDATCFLS